MVVQVKMLHLLGVECDFLLFCTRPEVLGKHNTVYPTIKANLCIAIFYTSLFVIHSNIVHKELKHFTMQYVDLHCNFSGRIF